MIEHDCASDHAPEDRPATLAFDFTGSGSEYFRIWIVNLLLTVATLGIYSAWAKTRRLQYFYRNTQLAGASFDFRGNPAAILRGRLLAVALVAAYQYAFGFSAVAGAVTVTLLVIALPFMMRSALRFRLSNTWYRGLPFDFAGDVPSAYRVYALPVALLIVPGALVALLPAQQVLGGALLLYFCWPLMHAAMKSYQHSNLVYGNQRAAFSASITELATPYVLVFVGAIVFGAIYVGIMFAAFSAGGGAGGIASSLVVFGGFVLAYLMFALGALFVTVQMNNIAWSETSFPKVRIASSLRLPSYFRLQAVNVLLTLLSLGLYRPFAAVRTWRYRLAHVHVEAPEGVEAAAGQASRRPGSAAGDGSAEFLGLDLSW